MTVFTDVVALGVVSEVDISWTAATEGGGFAGVMQYEGDYTTDPINGPWTPLFSLQSGLSFAWTGPFPAVGTYYVRVRAYDGQDYGPYSVSAGFSMGLQYTCEGDPAVPTYTDVPDGA